MVVIAAQEEWPANTALVKGSWRAHSQLNQRAIPKVEAAYDINGYLSIEAMAVKVKL